MCGIAGILRLTPPGEAARAALDRTPFDAIPEAWLDRLDESICHRGPDGQGRFRDRAVRADGTVVDVGLVHRRLSIIDHTGGAQPMVSQLPSPPQRGPGASLGSTPSVPFHPLVFHGKPNDAVHYQQLPDLPDTLSVVFNGCIYNHRELRRELETAGHSFATDHSDTEVLLHGWREWQHLLIRRLDGMFAFAMWNRSEAKLRWSRDCAGEKPLHVIQCETSPDQSTVFVFSSVAASLSILNASVGVRPLRAEKLMLWDWIEYGCGAFLPTRGVSGVFPGTTNSVQHLSREVAGAEME